MTQTKKKYLKISKGQISKKLIERTDIKLLDDSGQEITNFYNTKYGALKTVQGTKKVLGWNNNTKLRMLKIILPNNNNDGFILFNGTSHTMQLFNHLGVNLSSEISCEYITTTNLSKLNIAQQQDLCLLCTTDAPLIKINISANNLSWELFTIPTSKILQYTPSVATTITPNIFRNNILNDSINNFPVFINSAATPPTGTVTVYNLVEEKNENIFHLSDVKIKSFPASKWAITSYTVTDPGTGYTVGDTVTANGLSFEITTYTGATAEISLIDPQESYNTDKAGDFTVTGGTGSDMTIKIVTNELQYRVGDVLEVKGIGCKITTLQVGESLEILNDSDVFTEDPTEENVPTSGGSSSGMIVDVFGDYKHRTYSESSYTFQNGDVLQDLFGDKTTRQYFNNAWVTPNDMTGDIIKNGVCYGLDNINTGSTATLTFYRAEQHVLFDPAMIWWEAVQGSVNFVVTATTAEKAKQIFLNKIIGTLVSANDNNMGVMRVSSASLGNITNNGNGTFTVPLYAIRGILQIGFVSGDHGIRDTTAGYYRSLKFEFSQQRAFAGGLPNTADNPTNSLDFPQSILFYQQRLFIGGTKNNRQQIIASRLAEYNDFSANDYTVSDAFQLIISSDKKETIQHLFLNQGIQVFCKDSEWIVNSQQVSSSSGFLKNSEIGSNVVYPSLSANGITLFVPSNGKGIIAFTYNYEQANYATPYISLFTDLLDVEIIDMCLKRGQNSNEDTLLLICNSDGDLIIGNYLTDHEIQAFCRRHEENTKFIQCLECEDNVFMITERNGLSTLEVLDKDCFTSIETQTFTYLPSTKTLTTTDGRYFEQTVNTYDSNKDFIEKVEISALGVATLESETIPAYIGLNIPTTFESNPLNYSIETYNAYKNIRQIKLVISHDNKGKFITINEKPARKKENFLEYYRVAHAKRDCRFTINSNIYPCEILSMELDLTI